jgi:hypothetical protein
VTRTEADSALDARYGRSRSSHRRGRWFAIAAALVFAAVLAAWVVWAGLAGSAPALEAEDTGYKIVSDREVSVRFQLTTDPGREVDCAVQALDEHYEIVGWKIVSLPASEARTRAFVESVRTVSPANTGLISKCWLP